MCNPGYSPSNDDILRTRMVTTGIVEINFDYQAFTIKCVGVNQSNNQSD